MFTKGISGNPNGRKHGTANIATNDIRNAIHAIVNNNIKQLQTDIDAMAPGERIKCLISLMDFVLPKMQRIEIENNEVYRNIIVKLPKRDDD